MGGWAFNRKLFFKKNKCNFISQSFKVANSGRTTDSTLNIFTRLVHDQTRTKTIIKCGITIKYDMLKNSRNAIFGSELPANAQDKIYYSIID